MLLGASSRASEHEADLGSTVGKGSGAGVEHGRTLLRYAEVANQSSAEILKVSEEILDLFGPGGLVDAAATVSVFNGLVRSADAIGIPLDDVVLNATVEHRASLGIDEYSGAAQSRGDRE